MFGSPWAVGETSSGWMGKIWSLDNLSTDIQFRKNWDILDLKGHVNLGATWNIPLAKTGIKLCTRNATVNGCTHVGRRVP